MNRLVKHPFAAGESTGDPVVATSDGFEFPPIPEGYPVFRPAWLLRRHLQTVAAQFLVGRGAVKKRADATLEIPLADGSGDRLVTKLRRPGPGETRPRSPLVVLFHGLAGSAESPYLRSCAGDLRAAGYRTLLVNMRGCGESAEICRQLHHPQRTSDLADLFRTLERHDGGSLAEDGFFPIGMSLGGDMLLKFLADGAAPFAIRGAAAVSPTLDLGATTSQVESARVLPYPFLLLRWMKQEMSRPTADITEAERRVIAEVRTISEFHERFTTPHFGHPDVSSFYAACSPVPQLDRIRVPTAIFYAADDPLVPPHAYHGVDWASLPRLKPFLVDRGGHVGFRQVTGSCWHNLCILRLLEEASPERK